MCKNIPLSLTAHGQLCAALSDSSKSGRAYEHSEGWMNAEHGEEQTSLSFCPHGKVHPYKANGKGRKSSTAEVM
jgi:hypothetical protein